MIFKTLVAVLCFAGVVCHVEGVPLIKDALIAATNAIGLGSRSQSNETSELVDRITWADEIKEEILSWMQGSVESAMLEDGVPDGFRPFYAADSKEVEKKIKLLLYTGTGTADVYKLTGPPSGLIKQGLKPNTTTVLIIHGYGKDSSGAAIQPNKNRLLETSTGPINVIGVDWSSLCPRPFYVWSRANVKPTGDYLGEWLAQLVTKSLLRPSDIHIIGHSLGAHVAGTAGKTFYNVTGERIARVTGLDPARPLFSKSRPSKLSKTDANLVDVIHTAVDRLGIREELGQVDFYANGGTVPQPGCGVDLSASCSHERVCFLLAESIGRPESFPGHRCPNTGDTTQDNCTGALAHMGYNGTFRAQGRYYFKTRDESPFDPTMHTTPKKGGS